MIDVKKLKVGDKVRRINEGSSYFQFIKGNEYEVHSSHGELYVYDEVGTRCDLEHLKANSALWEHVEPEEEQVGFVYVGAISLESTFGGDNKYYVNVETDRQGLDSLRKLQQKSEAQEELRNKDAEIAALEERLERLKEERKTLI